ncbi:hypothetical protein [Planococcus halocryophilus]|uniref:Uncharacterized protein n=1 Tax=Planococcus halocryophilus TaxID=1215089 RepID=A0A1C7DNG2_9BACL|nr:hypothetical protein [Planococcus halocryophilus]ANU13046.1 hypothetical protein BBI08_03955 [Planococcus halocryophilus]
MFFEDARPTIDQKKGRDKAIKISHEFYGWALLGHAVYSIFFLSKFNASFWILVCGSIIYSLTNFYFSKRRK